MHNTLLKRAIYIARVKLLEVLDGCTMRATMISTLHTTMPKRCFLHGYPRGSPSQSLIEEIRCLFYLDWTRHIAKLHATAPKAELWERVKVSDYRSTVHAKKLTL